MLVRSDVVRDKKNSLSLGVANHVEIVYLAVLLSKETSLIVLPQGKNINLICVSLVNLLIMVFICYHVLVRKVYMGKTTNLALFITT